MTAKNRSLDMIEIIPNYWFYSANRKELKFNKPTSWTMKRELEKTHLHGRFIL